MNNSVVFARSRQCAPHLIHASLGPPEFKFQTAFRSVQPFCTADGREYPYFTMGAPLFPLKLPLPMEDLSTHLIQLWFLGPTRVLNPNGSSIGSAVFAQLTADCPHTLQWATRPPSKFPFSRGDLNTHLIHGSLGPPEFSTQTHLDRFSRFAGLTSVTDLQTDRQTTLLGR